MPRYITPFATPADVQAFLAAPLPDAALAGVSGNAPRDIKELPVKWLDIFHQRPNGFVAPMSARVHVTQVDLEPVRDAPDRLECRVVCEVVVAEDMLNGAGKLHGGCIVFLIDELSTLALPALSRAQGGNKPPGVTQAIHTVFHAPADLGATLRIINTSVTLGARVMSCRCEIWDADNRRLVASGVQLKMHSDKGTHRL